MIVNVNDEEVDMPFLGEHLLNSNFDIRNIIGARNEAIKGLSNLFTDIIERNRKYPNKKLNKERILLIAGVKKKKINKIKWLVP